MCICVCVCVRACVRACVCACMCVSMPVVCCFYYILYFTVSSHKKSDTGHATTDKSSGAVVTTQGPSPAVLKVAENIKVSPNLFLCFVNCCDNFCVNRITRRSSQNVWYVCICVNTFILLNAVHMLVSSHCGRSLKKKLCYKCLLV